MPAAAGTAGSGGTAVESRRLQFLVLKGEGESNTFSTSLHPLSPLSLSLHSSVMATSAAVALHTGVRTTGCWLMKPSGLMV